MAATATATPKFNTSALMKRGYFPHTDSNFNQALTFLEANTEVTLKEKANDGSVTVAIKFYYDDPNADTAIGDSKPTERKFLHTEYSFIREPDDWHDGHDHHIIASVSDGCIHDCVMCVDGIRLSLR